MGADVEEVLFKRDGMVVFWCARDFRSIIALLRKEAGDFDDGSHGDDTGVGGEGAWWLLGGALVGALVGDRASLSVVASVGRRLGSERRLELGRSHRSEPRSVRAWDANPWDGSERFQDVGRFWPRSVRYSEANGVRTSVGWSLKRMAS